MKSRKLATGTLLTAIGLMLSACVESVDYYGSPAYGYAYPAYGSIAVAGWGGWGGWHHGWDHGHWDDHVAVAHAHGGWGHGFGAHGGGHR